MSAAGLNEVNGTSTIEMINRTRHLRLEDSPASKKEMRS
jgi:hypothetical protein